MWSAALVLCDSLHELSVLTDEMLWYLANRDNRFAYVVVLSEEQPAGSSRMRRRVLIGVPSPR